MSLPDTTEIAAEAMNGKVVAPEYLLLPPELGQAILNYLAARPYLEVFELVAGLQALEQAKK